MKKYLILGGAGFIASHLSEALLDQGNKVVIIDTLSVTLAPNLTTYKINIENAKKVASVFQKEKPDFVFHLAGAINLRRAITDPLFLKDLDFLSRTKIVLDACIKYNVKKIIFISSGGAIYENATIVPTKEDYNAHPTSLYGLANLAIEKYIEAYCVPTVHLVKGDKYYHLDFTIARVSNAYGPRQWQSGFVPAVIAKILNNERPVIYGTGNQTRDFIYIDDVIGLLIVLAEKGKNDIYNVGSGKEVSLNKVLKLTGELLGVNIKPVYKNSSIQETQRSAVDIKKIKKELGFIPKISMKEGLLKTIESFQKNEKP